eukprot:6480485-Amphidinium_carterae.2
MLEASRGLHCLFTCDAVFAAHLATPQPAHCQTDTTHERPFLYTCSFWPPQLEAFPLAHAS